MGKRSASNSAERSAAPEYRLFACSEQEDAIRHICEFTHAKTRAGRGSNFTYNDIICAADTETSKTGPDRYDDKGEYVPQENIVVAWTFSARGAGGNICTVYGSRPSELVLFLAKLQDALPGEKTFVFWHNLSFDWQMVELFFFQVFGFPVHQLNVRPHYPISIDFDNGIIFRDSLIIAQKSLERWADDLDVEHKKAVGKWDYERFRDQRGGFTADELQYIEQDTLALVECLDKLREHLGKHVYSIPMTCTSIIREETRNAGRRNRARDRFLRLAPCYELYKMLTLAYHGGYTHNNRHAAGWIWPDEETDELPTCYDFASSYPHRMLVDKFPMERFRRIPDRISRQEILKNSDNTAFVFTFYAEGVRLKDPDEPMPALQFSKCLKTVNCINDNGRILTADAIEIVLTEIDLRIIDRQYAFDRHVCFDAWVAAKKRLPRWLRDVVYSCFRDKTTLKGGDTVSYALAKARLR